MVLRCAIVWVFVAGGMALTASCADFDVVDGFSGTVCGLLVDV